MKSRRGSKTERQSIRSGSIDVVKLRVTVVTEALNAQIAGSTRDARPVGIW